MSRRTLTVVVWLAVLPVAVAAQQKTDWESLRTLQIGEKIEVVEKSQRRQVGGFVAVTDEAISFRVEGADVGVPRADVLRVVSREKSKRLRNAVIGAALIGGIATGVGFALDSKFTETGEGNTTKRILIPLGLGAGAAIGATRPGYRTVYQAPRP